MAKDGTATSGYSELLKMSLSMRGSSPTDLFFLRMLITKHLESTAYSNERIMVFLGELANTVQEEFCRFVKISDSSNMPPTPAQEALKSVLALAIVSREIFIRYAHSHLDFVRGVFGELKPEEVKLQPIESKNRP